MPFEKNEITKIILGLVVAGSSSAAHASDAWDCAETERGWRCAASSNFTPDPVPLTRLSATEDAIEAQISNPKRVSTGTANQQNGQVEPNDPSSALTESDDTESDEALNKARLTQTPSSVDPAQALTPSDSSKIEVAAKEANNDLASAPKATTTPDGTQRDNPPSIRQSDPLDDRRDKQLDWVRMAPLDAENTVCKGRYLEPNIWVNELAPDNDQSTTTIDADRSDSQLGGLSILDGNIVIEESGRQIKAEHAEFDSQSRQALLRQDVRYREPNFLITADAMSADLETDVAIANQARFVMHDQHMRGDAATITRFGNERVEAEDTLITYCEPGSNDWGIRAAEMELFPQEGYGEAYHTRFEVAGVPVFYLPYFYWPLDDTRRTGLLYPSYSSSEEDGYDIALPYYFNIAPNIDDTLTTRLIENRGVLFENEARVLNAYGMNTLATSWLPDDDMTGSERWLFDVSHSGTPAPNWSSNVEFTRVSDNTYFDDLTPVTLAVPASDDLSQKASLAYQADNWTASALVNDYQSLDTSYPYARLPQLDYSMSQSWNDTSLGLAAQFTRFDHPTEGVTDADRIHARPTLEYRAETTWGYLIPEVGLWHSQYDFSNRNDESRTQHFASLDSGLIFERQGEISTQTLEPRIKLIHVDGDDTNSAMSFDSGALGFSYGNLFDTLGYTGNDQVAQTQQATLGLESKLYSISGREVVTAGIAQAHYLNDHDRRPGDTTGTANQSDYALLASWKPSEVLTLSHDSRLDKETGTLLTENYRAFYRPDNDRLLYANLRKTQSSDGTNTFNQVDLASRWPLSNEWSVVTRYTQDIKESENLETLAGFEYENCCWKLRFTGQRSIVDGTTDFERENTFYIQFILRGLGAFGQKEGRQFLEDLTGYNEDDNAHF